MTEADLQKIISILEGPIPGKMATCKEILDHSVQYHKCAGSLLDEVLRLKRIYDRCKEALLVHDQAHKSLLKTEFQNEDLRHWTAADDLFWSTMRDIFGDPK